MKSPFTTRHKIGDWSCYKLRIGNILKIHWHAGFLESPQKPGRHIRLRSIFVFGWKLPLKYYDS